MVLYVEILLILTVLSTQGAQQLEPAVKGIKQGFVCKHHNVLAHGKMLAMESWGGHVRREA